MRVQPVRILLVRSIRMSDSYSECSPSASSGDAEEWLDSLTPILSDLAVSMNRAVGMLGLIAKAAGANEEDIAEVLTAQDEVEA